MQKGHNIIRNTTEFAMTMISQYLEKGDTAIDATCGNGYDTQQLCEMTGPEGNVIAIDIQEEALKNTEKRLAVNNFTAKLAHDSHENIDRYAQEQSVKAIVFNLGYLPGGDKAITTSRQATMTALEKSLKLLARDGIICLVLYSGHPEGRAEKEEILRWAAQLHKGTYHCAYISMINQPANPPEILLITRKK